jgi:hypothetical protein
MAEGTLKRKPIRRKLRGRRRRVADGLKQEISGLLEKALREHFGEPRNVQVVSPGLIQLRIVPPEAGMPRYFNVKVTEQL